jgi:hypothetical protein
MSARALGRAKSGEVWSSNWQGAEVIKNIVTKLSLVMSHKPSAAAAESIVRETKEACDHLVAALG